MSSPQIQRIDLRESNDGFWPRAKSAEAWSITRGDPCTDNLHSRNLTICSLPRSQNLFRVNFMEHPRESQKGKASIVISHHQPFSSHPGRIPLRHSLPPMLELRLHLAKLSKPGFWMSAALVAREDQCLMASLQHTATASASPVRLSPPNQSPLNRWIMLDLSNPVTWRAQKSQQTLCGVGPTVQLQYCMALPFPHRRPKIIKDPKFAATCYLRLHRWS
jgi:hypothetical protein